MAIDSVPQPVVPQDIALLRSSALFQAEWYLERYPDVRAANLDPARHYLEYGGVEERDPGPDFDSGSYLRGNLDVKRAGLNPLLHYLKFGREEGRLISSLHARWIEVNERLEPFDREAIQLHIASFSTYPLIAVIVPVYRTDPRLLREMLASVTRQTYPHWQCCIADDNSESPEIIELLRAAAEAEPRIRLTLRDGNGNVCAATNTALEQASGEFVCLLDHDDVLHENALYEVAAEILAHPEADIIYSDSDSMDDHGHRFDPYFKPDWNYDLMLGLNLISHLGVYRRSLVEAVGGMRTGYEGSQDYDLALRVAELTKPERIRHVPAILYHWRRSTLRESFSDRALEQCVEAARAAIAEHLRRRGVEATLQPSHKISNFTRVVYALPAPAPLATVGVVAAGQAEHLVACLSAVLFRTSYSPVEVLVLRQPSEDAETCTALDRLEQGGLIRSLQSAHPLSLNKARNLLVEQAMGEVVVLLDSNIHMPDRTWLDELVSHALRPEIGLAGPIIVGSDGRLCEAGRVLGARHAPPAVKREAGGYFGVFALTRQVSALSPACLAFRKAVYLQAGGIDVEQSPYTAEVEFCLRVQAAGLRNLLTPHMEATLCSPRPDAKCEPEKSDAPQAPEDPFYSPHLSLDALFVETANPSRRVKPWAAIRNRLAIQKGQAMRAGMLLEGVARDARLLEIGASYSPIAPRSEGWNTKIVDHANRDQLVEKYKREPDLWVERIEEVDFIWTDGSIADALPAPLHGAFDYLIASHVIEHVPDLISFLSSAERILQPEGAVILAIPDKRFCFDYYRPLTMTGDVLEAHQQKRTRHTPRTAYEHWFYTVSRNGQGAWGQEPVAGLKLSNPFAVAMRKLQNLSSEPEAPYVDLHVWKFSPSSFELILLELARMGKTDWRLENVTVAIGCEFHAWLRRGAMAQCASLSDAAFDEKRLALLKGMMRELGEQARFAKL